MPRPGVGTKTRWMRWRRERYAVLRDVGGVPTDEAAAACTSPQRFAAAMKERGHDPQRWPELIVVRVGGKPRKDTPRHKRNTTWYHALRALGACARFASSYCKGPYVYAKGRRILKGFEVEQ